MANHGKLIQKFFWNFHFPGRHTGRITGKLVRFFISILGRFTEKLIHQNHEYLFSFFQFWGVTQIICLENLSIRFFDWSHFRYVIFGLDEFSRKTKEIFNFYENKTVQFFFRSHHQCDNDEFEHINARPKGNFSNFLKFFTRQKIWTIFWNICKILEDYIVHQKLHVDAANILPNSQGYKIWRIWVFCIF